MSQDATTTATNAVDNDQRAAGLRGSYFALSSAVATLDEIDFKATPDATGIVAAIDHARGTAPFWDGGPADYFAVQYVGFLHVDTPGLYTLYLTSDDGSALYLDGMRIIDNDGAHATRERSVTVELPVGAHEIEIVYFENSGWQTLELDWLGPDTEDTRRVIDGAAFSHSTVADVPGDEEPAHGTPFGLTAEYFVLPGPISSLAEVDFLADPDAVGTVAALDFSSRDTSFWEGGPTDYFAARYAGSLQVETGGSYTLFLTSDDGSALYVDGQRVINNDGAHTARERAVTLDLAAGTHAIEIVYFENGGLQVLELEWRGPDTFGTRQTIGGDALIAAAAPGEPIPDDPVIDIPQGLKAEFFVLSSSVSWLSDIDFTATPAATGTVGALDYALSNTAFWQGGPSNLFAARYTGALNVEMAGSYTLFLTSDDGSALYIDGERVIDNDGAHAARERAVTLDLAAGTHALEIVYFENGGRQVLELEWSGPDTYGSRQTISGASLLQATKPDTPVEQPDTPVEEPTGHAADLLASVSEGVGLADPSLAVGLSGFSYWKSPPFLNLMKQAALPGVLDASGSGVSSRQLLAEGYLDKNAYPTAMYPGQEALPAWQQGYNITVSIHHENDFIREETSGDYVVEWAGAGRIELRGFAVASQEVIYAADGSVVGGRMTGNWGFEDNLKIVKILDTDPDGTGNYIRDISIVRAEYKDMYDVGAIFDPRYTALIEDHHTLRFMDWMRTNGSDVKSLDDVASMDSLTWAGSVNTTSSPEISPEGLLPLPSQIPFEVMVQLANEVGADPWFNIPLKADDAYVRALAAYVDAHLDDGLVAKFELSNEVWNWAGGFEQVREASLLGSDGATSTNIGDAREYYGYRSAEIRSILDAEMSRVESEVILGTQTVYYAIAQWVEAGVAEYFAQEGQSGQMSDVFDALAVTGYFNAIERDEFAALRQVWYAQSESAFAAGATATKHDLFVSRAADYLANGLDALTPDELALVGKQADGSFSSRLIDPLEGFLRTNFAENKRMADAWGLELIQYEADSHISPKQHRGDPEAEWYKALNKSPEMGALTARMMELFREEGGTLVNDFGQLGDTDYGLWGTRSHFADENPIAAAYDTYNATAADLFGSINNGRDPSAFLQGVTLTGTAGADTLIGTAQRDYLMGGDGSDLLVGGDGVDGLHGGAGVDMVLFAGSRDAFDFRLDGKMLIASGPSGEDRLVDVEILAFAGSKEFVRVSDLTGETPVADLHDLLMQFDADHGIVSTLF